MHFNADNCSDSMTCKFVIKVTHCAPADAFVPLKSYLKRVHTSNKQVQHDSQCPHIHSSGVIPKVFGSLGCLFFLPCSFSYMLLKQQLWSHVVWSPNPTVAPFSHFCLQASDLVGLRLSVMHLLPAFWVRATSIINTQAMQVLRFTPLVPWWFAVCISSAVTPSGTIRFSISKLTLGYIFP